MDDNTISKSQSQAPRYLKESRVQAPKGIWGRIKSKWSALMGHALIASNELYGQWIGLGKYELIDVNAEAARAIGLSESESPRKPIRITGTITRERPQAIALAENKRMQVPEPSSGILLLIGLAPLVLRRGSAK